MPACELIDFKASALTKTKIEANLVAALEEAEQLNQNLSVALKQAHLAALTGIEPEAFVVATRVAAQKLQGHLAFCEALAHKIERRRAMNEAAA
jgi:hypothetical protein